MLLYLINPANPLVVLWGRYALWKPLGLLTLAGLTPPEWRIEIIDETLGVPDYAALPRPDLVGITAFTSQAPRAYELAGAYRERGVPVVMGGIHASMCVDEASHYVDAVVVGEAEGVWAQVLEDAGRGALQPVYSADRVELDSVPPARHDLLPRGYMMGSVQTARGCPLNCSFCSVTAFNGGRYRHRPVESVVEEMRRVPERRMLIVDDNIIGVGPRQVDRAKELFEAMIRADLKKTWAAQTTINMGDDEELLALAARAGCYGVLVGFESPTVAGLAELHKEFNFKGRDVPAAVRAMQRHGILVLGAFIAGLDVDRPGIGRQIAETAHSYGLDGISVPILTPLPGTRLWEKLRAEQRIVANDYPHDWQYYTLGWPVAQHQHLSWAELSREKKIAFRRFYSLPRMAGRVLRTLGDARSPLAALLGNVFVSSKARLECRAQRRSDLSRGRARVPSGSV